MRKCPKCGKNYSEPPAKSRVDDSEICRTCSGMEAVQAAMDAEAITPDQADQILEALQNATGK